WADGQHDLATFYLDGVGGLERDDKLALEWFHKAAAQGHANAQYHIGYMYCNGRGIEKDEVEGIKWIAKAAEQGLAPAQWSLGTAYATGTAIKQDNIQAFKWVSLAREQGKGDLPAIPALEEKMTPQEVAEANRLIADFKRAHPRE